MGLKLEPDKVLHLKWGAAAAAGLSAALVIAQQAHPAVALAGGGALLAWALERYQAVRHEGTPDHEDMLYTFAPFALAALVSLAL